MFYKSIIQGRLSFGTQKSYDKVMKMYEYRTETYYKGDIIIKLEDVFNSEELSLHIPRYVGNVSEKSFKNTKDLLEYCSQFAVAGSVQAWMIDEGKIKHHANIEPDSDRSVVVQFRKGDQYFKEGSKNTEAFEAFSKTIESFEKHAQAYERRGWVNLRLKHFNDALYDFQKAISLDDSIAFAYYGIGLIKSNEGNTEEAIEHFDKTIKKSVALESIHWRGRLRKAEGLIELEEWDKAAFELKFFTKRKFPPNDSNNRRKPRGYALYGIVLYELGDHDQALEFLDKAIDSPDENRKEFNVAQAFYYRGLVKKAMRKKDAMNDIKTAAEQAYEPAIKFLAEEG